MGTEREEAIREAYCSWLAPHRPERAIAVTITFKPNQSGRPMRIEGLRDTVRHFSNRMNQKAYGRKFKRKERRLDFIPVMEGGHSPFEKHPHYHIQMEVPDGWSTDAWMRLAEEQLRKIRCVGYDQYRVRPVTDDGWQSYILKAQSKKSFADAIDVANLWVN